MLNISSLTARLGSGDPIKIGREIFPPPHSDFTELFDEHGKEVRGKPFRLDFKRYAELEFQGRLVWIVARERTYRLPVGYACSYWYRDLHFDERCAADDLWYVLPQYRRQGAGRRLKEAAHAELEKAGVTRIGDNIRENADGEDGGLWRLMEDMGFECWGRRWIKTFPGGSGS